jgi:thiamine pyrophosphokinase
MPAKEVDAANDALSPDGAGAPFVVSAQARKPMKVVVVASGELQPQDERWIDGADLLIAADGGAASLERLGRRPDRIVGDLDSADPAIVRRMEAAGVEVERHSPDKEASDTEIAVEVARAAGATEIVLLAALGGDRLDHGLANLLLLVDGDLSAVDLRLVSGPSLVRALRGGGSMLLRGEPGHLVTLLPIGEDAVGVTTDGLRWPLAGATLRLGRSRGLSNVVEHVPASVSLERGTLFVIETDQLGDQSS